MGFCVIEVGDIDGAFVGDEDGACVEHVTDTLIVRESLHNKGLLDADLNIASLYVSLRSILVIGNG